MKFDLVFEGGGAKGMAFVGALKEFLGRGHQVGRLLGTSAGAISAVLLAAGYTVEELTAALAEKVNGRSVFSDFMGIPSHFAEALFDGGDLNEVLGRFDIPFVPAGLETRLRADLLHNLAAEPPGSNIFSMVELGGWYSADSFLAWLERMLNQGSFAGKARNFGDMTLKQFAAATGSELSLIATDITQHILLVLNQRTAPDLPVRWAARMSMSIPLLWQDVIWQKEWGTYARMDFTGHSIVDGGVLSNFPIAFFLSQDREITDIMGINDADDVIGLLLDEQLEVPGAADVPSQKWEGIELSSIKVARLFEGLVDTLLEGHDKTLMESFEDRVVRLPAKGYGTTEFNMSDQRRELLISAGQAAMKTYLDGLDAALKAAPKALVPGPSAVLAAQADKNAARILYSSLLLVK